MTDGDSVVVAESKPSPFNDSLPPIEEGEDVGVLVPATDRLNDVGVMLEKLSSEKMSFRDGGDLTGVAGGDIKIPPPPQAPPAAIDGDVGEEVKKREAFEDELEGRDSAEAIRSGIVSFERK